MIAAKPLFEATEPGAARMAAPAIILAAALLLLSGCPEISIEPAAGPQGAEQMVIEVTGTNTQFSQSGTTASFSRAGGPSGIVVHYPLDIQSDTRLLMTITIPADEPTGPQTLEVKTGLYAAEATFEVEPRPGIRLVPLAVEQGDESVLVTVEGSHTHFDDPSCLGDPVVTVADVQVTNWQPSSATTATVEMTVGMGVPVGHYAGAFQIYCDYQTLAADLQITEAVRSITLVPDSVEQGSLASISIEANKAAFTEHFDVEISPPGGVEVSWSPPTDDKNAVIEVSVHSFAEVGGRILAVTDPYGTMEAELRVTEDPTPPSVVYDPAVVRPGGVVTIEAHGVNTSFALASTVVSQDPASGDLQLAVSDVLAGDLALLEADVDPQAEEREYLVTLTTGLEHVTGSIWVVPEPSITLDRSEGRQGESYTIHVLGESTHFDQQGSVVTTRPGSGLSVSNWQVSGPLGGSFVLHVAEGADATVVDGAITISTDVNGQWTETVSAGFLVLAGVPRADLTPQAVDQGDQGVQVHASGHFTSWSPGETSVTVDATCDAYLSVHDVEITGPTELTFLVDVELLARPMVCGIHITTESGSGSDDVVALLQIQSSATVIPRPMPQTLVGYVDGPQLYSMELYAGEVVRVRASSDPVLYLDPTLALYSPTGSHATGPVAENEDEHAATDDALIVYHVPTDGTYYLVVDDRLGFEVGAFTLSLDGYHLVYPSDPTDSGSNTSRSTAEPLDGPVVRGGIDASLSPRWYVVQPGALPSSARAAVGVVARWVSPFETSASDVLLRLFSSTTLLDSTDLGTEGPDPVLYVDTASLTHIAVDNDLGGLGSTAYWLNIRPWVVINEVHHDEVHDWEASFVELYGEPGASLAGCSLVGKVHDGIQESEMFNISLDGSGILESGYFVVAHDALVPGAGEPHINADLEIPDGPYVSVGVLLDCDGVSVDVLCWRGEAILGCEGRAVPDAATVGGYLGRGYHVDTNDNLQDFLPQPEPSPWSRNLREVW